MPESFFGLLECEPLNIEVFETLMSGENSF